MYYKVRLGMLQTLQISNNKPELNLHNFLFKFYQTRIRISKNSITFKKDYNVDILMTENTKNILYL